MKLCGIDSSTSKTAISLFIDGKYKEYKLIDLHKIEGGWNRVDPMILEIVKVLDKYKPDIIYQEDAYLSGGKQNPETMLMLCTIMGAVRYWALIHDCNYNKFKASTWRAKLKLNDFLANRPELKKKTITFIQEKYNINPETDDVSDSICIGLAGLKMEGITGS